MKKDSGLKRLSRTDLVDIIHRLQHNEVQLKEVNVELHFCAQQLLQRASRTEPVILHSKRGKTWLFLTS